MATRFERGFYRVIIPRIMQIKAKDVAPFFTRAHKAPPGSGLPLPMPDFLLIFNAILVYNPAHG